jgi:hypothetical protein
MQFKVAQLAIAFAIMLVINEENLVFAKDVSTCLKHEGRRCVECKIDFDYSALSRPGVVPLICPNMKRGDRYLTSVQGSLSLSETVNGTADHL